MSVSVIELRGFALPAMPRGRSGLRGLGAADATLGDLFKRVQVGMNLLAPRYAQVKALLASGKINTPAGKAAYRAYVAWSDALLDLFLAVGTRLRFHKDLLDKVAKQAKMKPEDVLKVFDGNNFKPVVRVQGLGVLPVLVVYGAIAAVAVIGTALAWRLSAGEQAKLEREQRESRAYEDAIKAGLGPAGAARIAHESAPPPPPEDKSFFDKITDSLVTVAKVGAGVAIAYIGWRGYQAFAARRS